MAPKSILIIRGGAIGDFILTLPAITAMRSCFLSARLELLANLKVAELAQATALVDQIRSLEAPSLAPFFAPNTQLDNTQAAFFASFDLILSYLYDPDSVFQSNVARCSRARFIQGPHRPNEAGGQHACEALLQPLESIGIANADAVPHLHLNTDSTCLPWPGRWLAIHPGSGSERKNWPEDHWQSLLVRLLGRTDFGILLVGGEAEAGRAERLVDSIPKHRKQRAFNLPLVQLARQLSQCAFFMGHDSGITHLAAALDMPGLVLWGETNAVIWRPRGVRMRVFQPAGGLGALTVDQVMDQLLTCQLLIR